MPSRASRFEFWQAHQPICRRGGMHTRDAQIVVPFRVCEFKSRRRYQLCPRRSVNRSPGYDPGGRRFESSRGYQVSSSFTGSSIGGAAGSEPAGCRIVACPVIHIDEGVVQLAEQGAASAQVAGSLPVALSNIHRVPERIWSRLQSGITPVRIRPRCPTISVSSNGKAAVSKTAYRGSNPRTGATFAPVAEPE